MYIPDPRKPQNPGHDKIRTLAFIQDQLANAPQGADDGTVRLLSVTHDDWCSAWKGRACDCNATMTLSDPYRPAR